MVHNDSLASIHGKEALCTRCCTLRPIGELNAEALHHHGAKGLECIDRKQCERRRRRPGAWRRR